jgi:cobalamin biosynthesis Mg chelatase CobN
VSLPARHRRAVLLVALALPVLPGVARAQGQPGTTNQQTPAKAQQGRSATTSQQPPATTQPGQPATTTQQPSATTQQPPATTQQPPATTQPGQPATTTTPGATTQPPPATTTAPGTSTTPQPQPAPEAAPGTGQAVADAARGQGGRGAPAGIVALVVATAAVLLLLALWGLARWLAFAPPWLVRWRHASAEAGWRSSLAWADFRDWLRFGR